MIMTVRCTATTRCECMSIFMRGGAVDDMGVMHVLLVLSCEFNPNSIRDDPNVMMLCDSPPRCLGNADDLLQITRRLCRSHLMMYHRMTHGVPQLGQKAWKINCVALRRMSKSISSSFW